MKHLLTIGDLLPGEIEKIYNLTNKIKERSRRGDNYTPLFKKTLALIFQKPSNRTRVSFEVAMFQLGGHAIYLGMSDIQLGRRETIGDTAQVLSRYVNGVVIRAFEHQDVISFAEKSTVPVINGLSDWFHPCQVIADMYTIMEKRKKLDNLKVAFIGDGNNVAHSWLQGAAKMGINLVIASPPGYEVMPEMFSRAESEAVRRGSKIELVSDPVEAVEEADVIYTDVWVSMGQEEAWEKRRRAFQLYQVNKKLISHAKERVLIMHCLPAHRGEEITDEVIDGNHSIVIDQAENRLHVQKAILVLLLT